MKKTVLVVEDEKFTRRIIVATLESYGFYCIQAENGQQALELLSKFTGHCDLILTDLNMPIMDGLAFIEAHREREKNTGLNPIPIVVLSSEEGEMVQKARSLEIDGYFIKSGPFHEFIPDLHDILKNRKKL